MTESTLFKDIQLVLPEGIRQGDLLVKAGKIVKIAPSITEPADQVIQESGLTLMPGVIDTHVHFREPGPTQKETIASGSKAAVSGGVTTFFDMPNNQPATITVDALNQKKQIAKQTSYSNYNFYIGATLDNLDELIKADNCPGIKIFMGSSTGNMLVDDQQILDDIFKHANKPIVIHSEDETMVRENMDRYKGSSDVSDHMNIRTPEAALACTKRAVELAKKHQQRLHILHLTTADEVDWLLSQDLPPYITVEVCIQHLLLHAPEVYDRLGTFAQINPPLRTESHANRLWFGLQNGLISSIVTDHAPHLIEEKNQPFGQAPSGMPGVETLLPLTLQFFHDQRATLHDVSRWLSGAAQRLFNIDRRGQLLDGYFADLVLVDLNTEWTIENKATVSQCGWSAFDGWTVKGRPIMTFVNGQMVFREGEFFQFPDVADEVVLSSYTLSEKNIISN
ncbi:dihydroorotase [Candidatus Marinamargulisbacteria bacterium SCGC AG-343-K17]|nr:dihydroorotase [Candidatus Marinamargulisbacteria bacterium SCGC AG-343-K17]